MFVLKVDVYFVFKHQTGVTKIHDTRQHNITVRICSDSAHGKLLLRIDL